MLIQTFDLSDVTGWCFGPAGSLAPESGSMRLRKPATEGPEIAAGRLADWCFGRFSGGARPDLVVVESPMEIAASRNDNSTKAQLLLHGALHGVCGVFGVEVASVAVATIRKGVCGQAFAVAPVRGRPRSSREAQAARKATKAMVLQRVILLGYLPHGCADDNRADAVAAWIWADMQFGRTRPRELMMFGETA